VVIIVVVIVVVIAVRITSQVDCVGMVVQALQAVRVLLTMV
jgi:hypothetical protein